MGHVPLCAAHAGERPARRNNWIAALGSAAARRFARGRSLARGVRADTHATAAAEVRPSFTGLETLAPSPSALYEQTLAAYVAATAPRARAIYQVGTVRSDGLSDLDLIVVPGPPRLDDGFFYSARVRLPDARRLFPHDARPLPFATREAIRFTSHVNRRLLFGEDVLADLAPAQGLEQDLSLLLEGFLKYVRFAEATARHGRAHAERLVSKATSLAYSLALFDRISGERRAEGYAAASLALRAQLTAPAARRAALLAELWALFAASLAQLELELAKRLPCGSGESVSQFASSFLHGARCVPGLDPGRLTERRDAIARYHASLAERGLFLGSLFAKAAYGAGAGAARERSATLGQRALGGCIAAVYRLSARSPGVRAARAHG
jgi:hypothetical protein